MSLYTPTLIIGAGPAGLAVAGRLRKMGLNFEVVEQSNQIAHSWQNHYDRLCLHTVKQLSHLPHLPFPEDYPLYVPRLDLVKYYENYAKTFKIEPHFNESVNQVKKENNQWITTTKSGKTYISDNVVVATGVNRVPHQPSWEGDNIYKGLVVHSRNYKNPTPFKAKRTLVIGMGNTGAELALDLAEKGVDVTISVRSPVTFVPRDVGGRPVQITAKLLEKIPFGFGDWLGTQIRKIVIGDLTKYGVPMSKIHPAVQLKETGKTPVIDLGTVEYIKNKKIGIVPNIKAFEANGVLLENGEHQTFDAIILATGYRAQLDDFVENVENELDKYHVPKSPIALEPSNKGMYYVGFDNYKLGGILGTIFNDSESVAKDIKGNQ
ncbi:MAG: flavin-containing monooxygenase [Saprospiraceae bacterium]